MKDMISIEELQSEFNLRVFEESYERIYNCLNRLSEEQVWQAPNQQITPVGCLVKHLLGNMQQWVYAGVLEYRYERQRASEFVADVSMNKEMLKQEMERVKETVLTALSSLNASMLTKTMVIQEIPTNGFSAMIHVIEHFSYHTGQIALITKMYCNEDLGFYKDLNLD